MLALFVVEVAGTLMWLAAGLFASATAKEVAQTVAGIVFLFAFYACAPLWARFLVPVESRNQGMKERLARVMASMPLTRPVFLYDHTDKNAYTAGILERHTRVYVTSGLMERVSDVGLKGILAHEDTHVREHHILLLFAFVCAYALLAHLAGSDRLFVFGFLAFLMLRRHLEYRADAGAVKRVGKDAMKKGLQELRAIYPSKKWVRWLMFAMPYPTLPMRIRALGTKQRPLF